MEFFDSSRNNFYVSQKELLEFYKMACEAIEVKYSKGEFNQSITKLTDICLLMPTRFIKYNTRIPYTKNLPSNMNIINKSDPNTDYFLTVSSDLLKDMLDISFGEVHG